MEKEPASPIDKNFRGSRSRRASSHDAHPMAHPPPRHQQTPLQTPGHGAPIQEYFAQDAPRSMSPAPDLLQGPPVFPTPSPGVARGYIPAQETSTRGPELPPKDSRHSDSGDYLVAIANGISKFGRNLAGETRREPLQENSYREPPQITIARLNRKHSELQEWYNAVYRDLEKSKEECTRLQEKLKAGKFERERLEAEYREYERQAKAKIDEMQRMSHRNMETGRNIGRQRSAIQKDLRALQTLIKNWAKAYCANPSVVKLEGEALEDFKSDTLRVRNSNTDIKLPLVLFVEALVAAHVFENIIAKPFFFLGKDFNCEYLDEIYARLQKSNANEAHVWRSQLLRLLYPTPRDDNTVEEVEVRSQTFEQKREACDYQAQKLLESNIRHALSSVDKAGYEKRGKELHDIYLAAGHLSLEIWSTRSYYRVVGIKELQDRNIKFEARSQLVEPHNRMALEEDDPRCDGMELSLVIRPALEAFGTDDAEKYWQSEVLVKAVVLVDES